MSDPGTVEIKRGVRLVKKHVKKDKKVEKIEKKVEERNGDERNGENEGEAELTVKLPNKKPDNKTSSIPDVKTETEVDVLKKILPDGTVEEVKTTTIKKHVNGKLETETKTEKRKLPKEEADLAKEQAIKEREKNTNESSIEVNNQNGDVTENTELVVKLPTKKSGAKTETKVEVENKILSDGTVEETKTTTTKTTIDGKTDITTKVDKRILSKEEADAVIEIEEEEEEIEEEETAEEQSENKANDNEKSDLVIKNDERTETTTTKKVVITQNVTQDEHDSEEENQEDSSEPEKTAVKQESVKLEDDEEEDVDEEVDEEQHISEHKKEQIITKIEGDDDEVVEEEEEEEYEEEKSSKTLTEKEKKEETISDDESFQKPNEQKENSEDEENEANEDEEKEVLEEEEKEEEREGKNDVEDDDVEVVEEEEDEEKNEEREVEIPGTQPDIPEQVIEKPVSSNEQKGSENVEPVRTVPIEKDDNKDSSLDKPTKEPTVPLEKVEDIEIKPIGLANETISKTKFEKTEIVMNTEKPEGPLSTQTEFNRYENIVKVNRTTKTLDNAYVQMTQSPTPTMKTYFAPNREKVSSSYAPQTTYQPPYPSDSTTERRHSLLLERLSVERQIPSSDIYQNNYQQYNNQNQDQQLWYQEPQSEVLTVSNVKPSTITNQQWYQQTKKENITYNDVPSTPNQQWNPSQPQYQPPTPIQTQTQPTYQQPYFENTVPDYSKPITNSYQKNNAPSFTPKTNNWGSGNLEKVENTANKYSMLSKETRKEYENSATQYIPGYVPPPWEQDTNYVIDNNNSQNYYQAPTQPKSTTNPISSSWKPTPPTGKFSKPVSTAYIPPAPNQSFVKPSSAVVEPPNLPGRKTYYSEYERRYITVPESTYIPGETKFQPQPNPSPKYYYDNNEPIETVEHQWRKELREFTEKTSQTQLDTQQESVKPPWEDDPKYAKAPSNLYSSTPSWSQTLRPRSWRERSFESEYAGSQEWPKTGTLGRSRPVSSYVQSKTDIPVLEKPRGVSVDRFNPNSYQSPVAEHPPVQSQTLTPTTAPYAKTYHNPSIPAYHARASAEPRDQPAAYQQPRMWGDSRESPIQSRSFKYLQWITGTEK